MLIFRYKTIEMHLDQRTNQLPTQRLVKTETIGLGIYLRTSFSSSLLNIGTILACLQIDEKGSRNEESVKD